LILGSASNAEMQEESTWKNHNKHTVSTVPIWIQNDQALPTKQAPSLKSRTMNQS